MSSTQVVVILILVVVLVLAAAAAWYAMRHRALRQRFGPEYDRAVADQDNRFAAERELRERERRHAELELRELSPESRERYRSQWEEVERRFVDDPAAAVREGDALVTQLVAERGYPTENYDDQVAHLSVEHARTLGHYREAHEISEVNQRGEATTEQLRQALVHYRALYTDILGETPAEERDEVSAERAEVEREEAEREEAEREEVPAERAENR
jgi:hypothetical protein